MKTEAVQPPRTVIIDGRQVNVSHLSGDDLFEAITADEEPWFYPRVAAEAGVSIITVRGWLTKFNRLPPGKLPNSQTFIAPDDYAVRSPWWAGGRVRALLIQWGLMSRAGQTTRRERRGRRQGTQDSRPRRPAVRVSPMRDEAGDVYKQYLELTGRRRNPLPDRAARAELCNRLGLTRQQLATRIKTARDQLTPPPEVDNAQLLADYRRLVEQHRGRGRSDGAADTQARKDLAGQTGLTRREIAGRLAVARIAEKRRGG